MYWEIAFGTSKNRLNFIHEDKIKELLNTKGFSDQLVYKSMWMYDDSVLEYKKKHNSMAGYDGIHYIDEVVFDVDKHDNTDEFTRNKAKRLLQTLEDLGFEENVFQFYWSGRAWHIHTSNLVWGFKPSVDLPYIVKETLRKILEPLGRGFYDESLYKKTAMIRVANTFNDKEDSRMYKIPVSKDEFLSADLIDIKTLAKHRRTDFDEYDPNEILNSRLNSLSYLIIKPEDVPNETKYSKNVERSNVACCIHRMIERGATEGDRNNALLRIASHFRRQNLPEDFVIEGLVNYWNPMNKQGLERAVIEKVVKTTYRSPYNYGCNDKILVSYCNPSCIFYGNKNYAQTVLSGDDMYQELAVYAETDMTGRTIDLGKQLGIKDKEIILEPGDLMTIISDTGLNKSTLLHQILLGFDFENQEFNPDYKIPALVVDLELTTAKFARRLTQAICKVSKVEALRNYKKYESQVKDAISHLILTRDVRDVPSLREKVINTGAKVVAIDYLQCFKPKGKMINSMQLLSDLPHELRDLATELQIIIIVLSQSTKADKINKAITLNSAKGSGDISDASTCCLTINGDKNDIYRTIRIEKMTDGDNCDNLLMEFVPGNFRLITIGE